MKILILTIILTISLPAFSRQYIQCGASDSWDRAVVNLDGDNSTLFMTTGLGVPNEIRILKDLALDSETDSALIYKTNEGQILEYVSIPKEVIGKYSNYFVVEMTLVRIDSGYSQSRQMSCFSSLYN